MNPLEESPELEAEKSWLNQGAYAHRGLHGTDLAENSLGAFRAAMTVGLGIECDVRKSADGRAIVFHDDTLDRLTAQSGPIHDRTVGELTGTALTVGGEMIPTLRDTLNCIAGQVPLLVEIKTRRTRPVGPICKAVRQELEGYTGKVAVMSFDPRVSRWFAERAPNVLRGLVITEENARTLSGAMRRRLSLWQARPDFLAYDIRDLPSHFASRQQRRGLPLVTWTVRNAQQRETADKCNAAPIAEGTITSALALELAGRVS